MNVNRLTVEGRDFFLPDPVAGLKNLILEAVKAGGGYVNIPGLRGGSGIDILFSPGMSISWTVIDVGSDISPDESATASSADENNYDAI